MVVLLCCPLNCDFPRVVFYKGDQNSSHLGEKTFAVNYREEAHWYRTQSYNLSGNSPLTHSLTLLGPCIIYSQNSTCFLCRTYHICHALFLKLFFDVSLSSPKVRDHVCHLHYLPCAGHSAQNTKVLCAATAELLRRCGSGICVKSPSVQPALLFCSSIRTLLSSKRSEVNFMQTSFRNLAQKAKKEMNAWHEINLQISLFTDFSLFLKYISVNKSIYTGVHGNSSQLFYRSYLQTTP